MFTDWLPYLPLVVSLLTTGMLYGMLRGGLDFLRKQVDRLEKTVDKNESVLNDLREEVHVKMAQHDVGRARAKKKVR